ncbi:hypothetical protein [Candidatus Tisiphia endosymbiont of Sialis lutaria]|uniref:hypothetical protein n=1 Tax=Candidatus Tisiphia endosymbiont of Sialis lutaria TaxID=2029164 RepID=UPI00312C9218
MEDLKNWQTKFKPCEYSAKLLNKLILLNEKVTHPVDIVNSGEVGDVVTSRRLPTITN